MTARKYFSNSSIARYDGFSKSDDSKIRESCNDWVSCAKDKNEYAKEVQKNGGIRRNSMLTRIRVFEEKWKHQRVYQSLLSKVKTKKQMKEFNQDFVDEGAAGCDLLELDFEDEKGIGVKAKTVIQKDQML